jgi:hypothetical protein
MAFTVKTITTWDIGSQEQKETFPAMCEARLQWLSQAVADGKTPEVSGELSGKALDENENGNSRSGMRIWVDETAANEWKTFVEELAAEINHTVTVQIEPI